MPTTLTGPWGVPLEILADMLAASAAFRTWTGSASAAAAKSGHVRIFTDFDFDTYPLALVNWADGAEQGSNGVSGGRPSMSPRVTGDLVVSFRKTYSRQDETDPQELLKAFAAAVFGVVADLQAMSGGEGVLPLKQYAPVEDAPQLTEFEDGHNEPVLIWDWRMCP